MTLEHDETNWIVRIHGDCGMTAAVELKTLLVGGLASRKILQVDMAGAGDIDITLLQLLWALAREAENPEFVTGVSPAMVGLAHAAGFPSFPGAAGNSFGASQDSPENSQANSRE